MNFRLIEEFLHSPFVGINMLKENKAVVAEKYDFGNIFGQYYLYLPPDGIPKDTIVVYIHGGSWKRGVPNIYRCVARRFSENGYHTISLGYRLAPLFKYPAQAEDVALAYSMALKKLNEQGISTDKVAIVGASAGGHLAGVLTYDKVLHKKYDINASNIKAYVSLGGILKFDLPNDDYAKKLLIRLFVKGYDKKNAEPYNLIDGSEKTKVLCMHSLYDPISSYESSKQFCKKLNSFNSGIAQCYLIDNPNILHTNLVSGLFLKKGPATYEFKNILKFLDIT